MVGSKHYTFKWIESGKERSTAKPSLVGHIIYLQKPFYKLWSLVSMIFALHFSMHCSFITPFNKFKIVVEGIYSCVCYYRWIFIEGTQTQRCDVSFPVMCALGACLDTRASYQLAKKLAKIKSNASKQES